MGIFIFNFILCHHHRTAIEYLRNST